MIIALDLETTWLDKNKDKIIEIALVKFDSDTFEIIETFSSLVNPGCEIPELTTNITNIRTDDILDAPYFDEIASKVSDFIWDLPILWHNVYFDRWFLLNNNINIEKNITLDTFFLANIFSRYQKSLSLESLCSFYELNLEWAHRALNDTIASVKLFERYIKELSFLDKEYKEIFYYIASNSIDSWFRFIVDRYIDKKTIKLDKNLFMKSVLSKFNDSKQKGNISQNTDLIVDNCRQFLSTIDKFETRQNQEQMSELVLETLNKNKRIIIEAPTWVWKTFAYLLPSILYSIQTWEQIFISTTTKALQDQIFLKDLEFLKTNLELDFSYSKLKWKSNYLWIYTFLRFFDESLDDMTAEKTSFLLKISFFIFESKTFELDELDFFPQEYYFSKQINADDKITFSTKNMFEDREPAVRARRTSRSTNIVVINNNILFQDIAWENNILSKVKNLVIDEAHNLEDVVTNSLKKWFSLQDIQKTFLSIEILSKKHKFSIDDFSKKQENIFFELDTLFDLFAFYINSKLVEDNKYKTILLKSDFFDSKIDKVDINRLKVSTINHITSLLDDLKMLPDELFIEINKEISHLETILDILSIILNPLSTKDYISIINLTENKWIYVEYTVLKPRDYLEKNLWNKLDSCVLTSATLQVNNDFSYINSILWLENFSNYALDTDFDYKKQALLYVPNDLWNIKNNSYSIINFLREFLSIVKWKTLVLFTSFFMIKEVYSALNLENKKLWINIYAQGIWWWKHKLLDFYKSNSASSVLLWTDTFWEWVDIPWDDLKYLIIHKVPFMVPSDPIFQARSSLFKNAFTEYSLAKAILKLKQGFWRLIRTKTDSWVVILLDDRIYSTSWWKDLFSAFPSEIVYKTGSYKDLLKVLDK